MDVLILKAVALEPQHGWAIGDRIKQISKDVLNVQQAPSTRAPSSGAEGLAKARWAVTANNRRAKYYELSKSVRKQLEAQVNTWRACRSRSATCSISREPRRRKAG